MCGEQTGGQAGDSCDVSLRCLSLYVLDRAVTIDGPEKGCRGLLNDWYARALVPCEVTSDEIKR